MTRDGIEEICVDKTMALIVTFNPDITRLQDNVTMAVGQTEGLVIVYNGSNNIRQIKRVAEAAGAELISLAKNQGLASALN